MVSIDQRVSGGLPSRLILTMPETTPFEICDLLTEAYADLSPIAATEAGIPGRDHLWDDFSPKARRRSKSSGRGPWPSWHRTSITRIRCKRPRPEWRAGIWSRSDACTTAGIGNGTSTTSTARSRRGATPSTSCRREGAGAWENVTIRLSTWGDMLDGYRSSLQVGLDDGEIVARRQVLSVIDQVRSVAGPGSPLGSPSGDRGCRWGRRGSGG